MSRARRTPPSGATLTTIRSAAPARATRRGSVSFRTLSSAAISTGVPAARSRVRTSARPSMVGTGCSAYSSPTDASRVRALTAAGTSHPPLASTRMAASGNAARTALSLAASSSSDLSTLGNLDLDRVHPAEPGEHLGHPVRGHGRHGGVNRHGRAQRSRETLPARFEGGGQPAGSLGVAVLRERDRIRPSRPARGAAGIRAP